MKHILFTLFLLISFSCGKSSSNGGGGATPLAKPTNDREVTGTVGGFAPLLEANVTGGCRIRLVSPIEGETIDLSNGKSYEFAWTTDGTTCETPYTIYAAGNPANIETGENIISAKLSISVGQISKTGGFINVTFQDLAELKSENGVYHWCVSSFYGSHPASISFKVKR